MEGQDRPVGVRGSVMGVCHSLPSANSAGRDASTTWWSMSETVLLWPISVGGLYDRNRRVSSLET